ncbi:diguanylate cyclase [Agromyces sp. G08B096]|uniref:Diguanylate cyclase n=1 Tax=Agromyces sp. G08B096 TaxID=3156399 RepID=A0AAU7W9A5_9MICO
MASSDPSHGIDTRTPPGDHSSMPNPQSASAPEAPALPRLTSCGLIAIDPQGAIVDTNPVLLDWLGSDRADVLGRPLESILQLRMPLAGGDGMVPTDATLHGASGIVRPVVIGAIEGVAAGGGMQIAVYDVSARSAFRLGFRGAEAKTERGRQRLQILLNSSVGFAETRSETDAAELLVDVAQRAFAATFVSVHLREPDGIVQVAGVNPLAGNWPKDFRPAGTVTLLNGGVLVVRTPDDADAYVPGVGMSDVYRRSGIEAAISSPLRYKGDALGSMICYFDHPREFDDQAAPLAEALSGQAAQAITRIRLEETLRRAAMHDEVTGLPSRRLFEEDVNRALLNDFAALAVLFIDLDGFKSVNDRMGHASGDSLLTEVGARLRGVIRERDVLGRFGGDEFIAVAEIDRPEDALALAERIRVAVAEPYDDLPADLRITASIGVVTIEGSGEPIVIDQLIRTADHAMYEAKMAGGDRVAALNVRSARQRVE